MKPFFTDDKDHLLHMDNGMLADSLTLQEARASIAMVLNQLFWNIQVSALGDRE